MPNVSCKRDFLPVFLPYDTYLLRLRLANRTSYSHQLKVQSEIWPSLPAADPIPDATAWDADFSKKHWVTPPDRHEPGCSMGFNPFWAVRVQLVSS